MLKKVVGKATDALLVFKEGLLFNNIINSSMILLYHRVLNYDSDPQLLAVSVDNFRDQMQYLKKNYQLITLEQLTKGIIENRRGSCRRYRDTNCHHVPADACIRKSDAALS